MKEVFRKICASMLYIVMVVLFSNCGDNDEPEIGGQLKTLPGAVKMEIDGSMQEIDKATFEIPENSDFIDLTVYSDRGGLREKQINIENSNSMTVELLDPATPETEPYQTFGYGENKIERFRHTIRVSTSTNTTNTNSVEFYVENGGTWYTFYQSKFTVTK
ncbi:MAG: hypothetical protein NC338_08870 [Firmicutes bacterium]|nr:hypothetical protein [Bacillota bacterium]MCM1400793.1 hypothetical protein [Bacteroides sp.]MCM1476705.1 hypothetical protein [Bacteroides sp.]